MRITAILVVLILLFCLSCGDDSPIQSHPQLQAETTWNLTPLEDETAELMALWLSNDLVAPMDLYYQIKHDLDTIQSQLGDSLEVWDDSCDAEVGLGGDPSWKIGFDPGWRVSFVSLKLDDSILAPVLSGQHTAWNELADSLRIDSVVQSIGDPTWPFVNVYFAGRLNSYRLVEYFENFPGITWVSWQLMDGDRPVIIPHRVGDQLNYFYRFSWGDCPLGCMNNHVYYISVENGSAVVLDDYGPPYSEPHPEWAETAGELLYKWRTGEPPQ